MPYYVPTNHVVDGPWGTVGNKRYLWYLDEQGMSWMLWDSGEKSPAGFLPAFFDAEPKNERLDFNPFDCDAPED